MTDEQMAARFDRLEAGLTARFDEMDRRFESIDRRFESIDRRFESIDRRFEKLELRLEHLDKAAVTRTDLFQSVIVAQGLFYAGVLASIAVPNAVGAFG